jgi:hypothetical protein
LILPTSILTILATALICQKECPNLSKDRKEESCAGDDIIDGGYLLEAMGAVLKFYSLQETFIKSQDARYCS